MNLAQKMSQACETLRAGRLAEAETSVSRSACGTADAARCVALLGCTLSKLGRADEALDLIRRAVNLNPQQPVYHANLGLTLLRRAQNVRRSWR